MSKQNFSSALTSVNSSKLPSVFRKAKLTDGNFHGFLLDYGCGRFTDHIRDAVAPAVYLPYDPYNKPQEENDAVMWYVRKLLDNRIMMTIVCSNVLNVIDDDGTIRFIADSIENVVFKTGSIGYITVYEGDRSGIGRQTGPDQYQRNEPLRNYLRFFRNAHIKNGMIIVER